MKRIKTGVNGKSLLSYGHFFPPCLQCFLAYCIVSINPHPWVFLFVCFSGGGGGGSLPSNEVYML